MTQQISRMNAIASISETSIRDGVVDYTNMDVREIYAEHVFSETIQRRRLPKAVYASLRETIQSGKELDAKIGDSVALAMRDWAIEHGVTHFTHWFQPMTGSTAEKHDSFVTPISGGGIVSQFSGKDLVRGEPDASSFPSGGLRATFEARGYTAWDPSSPAFIIENPNGATLVIPTMFLSWTGDALDRKTPLLRSMEALSNQAMRLLKIFGKSSARRVCSSVGCEQEYFLVDKKFYLNRPDLVATGRTLFGAKPPKGQELDDQYFGAINQRVLSFMAEVEYDLLRLGVPIKTRHNEVAPGQYELAPTFETSNIATDHQMLTMEIMRKVADKHGFAILFHEKPFAGINGSGKHINWSIDTDDGENLLNPGKTPLSNAQFLVFCSAVCKAVHKHAGLLRMSIAGAGNDHRLGANEAPPAIISIYLGAQLSEVFRLIKTGKKHATKKAGKLEIGVSMLPTITRHAVDRNRTSPFAFTGNKFEFRAAGSSMNPSSANTVINTIVAESLDEVCSRLEKMITKRCDLNKAVQKLLPTLIDEFEPVLFEGDNYSQEWHDEAKQRGLENLKNTVDCAKKMTSKESVSLFKKYGVFKRLELVSRKEIMLENYATIIGIEADTASMIARTMILPAALKYQADVACSVNEAKAAGVENARQLNMLKDLAHTIGEFLDAVHVLDGLASDHSKSTEAHAGHMSRKVLPAMEALREIGDKLEQIVDDSYWPLPTYREMLFIR